MHKIFITVFLLLTLPASAAPADPYRAGAFPPDAILKKAHDRNAKGHTFVKTTGKFKETYEKYLVFYECEGGADNTCLKSMNVLQLDTGIWVLIVNGQPGLIEN